MLKVKVMSDLHVDVNSEILGIRGRNFEEAVIEHILEEKNNFDVLLIVGDLSNDMLYSLKILNRIDEALCNEKIIKFVPGNHDVSSSNGYGVGMSISSDMMIDFYNQSPYSLKDAFELTENTVLIGGLGWYDYSFYELFLGDNDSDIEVDSYCRSVKDSYWYDGRRVNFTINDSNLCMKENMRYENLIKTYEDKEIFLINHFVPFYRYVKVERNNALWNVCNAFIGSQNLGNIIEENENVKYVAFGHTHFRQGVKEIGDRKEICVPLGYFGEWSIFEELSDDINEFGGNLEQHVKEVLTLSDKKVIIKKELEKIKTIIEIN